MTDKQIEELIEKVRDIHSSDEAIKIHGNWRERIDKAHITKLEGLIKKAREALEKATKYLEFVSCGDKEAGKVIGDCTETLASLKELQ